MMLRFACLAVAVALHAPLPAAAQSKGLTEFCKLMDTAEGFVALRDAPNAQAAVIEKMDPKGTVIPRTDRARWKRGSWILVSYRRPGIEFAEALKSGPVGWMNEKLHQGCG